MFRSFTDCLASRPIKLIDTPLDTQCDQSDYMVGKLAAVEIPHWLSLFLVIMIYPSCPQLVPQLESEYELQFRITNVDK